MQVEGDVAFIAYRATWRTVEVVIGTDTFVVRDDKIAVQTYVAHSEPR